MKGEKHSEVRCDTQTAMHMAESQVSTSRTGRDNIRLQFIRELIQNEKKGDTLQTSKAGAFTKALHRGVLERHCLR